MGLEASLKLLDLPPDATIDDANQAYGYLHRMIDLFHQDPGAGDRGDRQEDMDLLTCAYEKAVAYLSNRDPQNGPSLSIVPPRLSVVDRSPSTDPCYAIKMSAESDKDSLFGNIPSLPEPNARTVEEAISITSRRMQQTESALAISRKAVDSALANVDAASRRHDRAKQASLAAAVAATSGKNRALLLEIEAKRAMQDAVAVAERARARVAAARQAAKEATAEADKARKQAIRIKKSEETAAAEVVCAEDLLEKEKTRLKALTHTLVEARSRMRMFQDATAVIDKQVAGVDIQEAVVPGDQSSSAQAVGGEAAARQRIMCDLLEIEASLNARKQDTMPAHSHGTASTGAAEPSSERRQYHRVVYPADQGPLFSMDGHEIPILDLCTTGMRLEPDAFLTGARIVRGVITFSNRSPVNITGKVVRRDDDGLGLKLVTRIGNHILDQERLRLGA